MSDKTNDPKEVAALHDDLARLESTVANLRAAAERLWPVSQVNASDDPS